VVGQTNNLVYVMFEQIAWLASHSHDPILSYPILSYPTLGGFGVMYEAAVRPTPGGDRE
jgi:uncharacterized protein with LGFP repeats